MKTEPDKYDAMSSNFHDEHYDFSETVTQGNDDDFTSEMDQDESGWYETSYHEQKYSRRPVEKIGCVNGNIRNSVPPHAHLLNQKRHSLGRIHAHGYPSHHAKPIRAFSIQTEHPCSPLAKESPRRHSSDKEWQETNDDILQTSLKSSQRTIRSDSVGQNRKPICTCLNEMIPTKRDKVLQKQRSVNEADDPLLFSQQAQDFLFIDDIPEANKVTDSNENSTSLKNVLQMNDVSFDDLSEFGAAACENDITGSRLPKSVEMSTKGRLKLLHDHRSIEEHAV